MVVAKETVGSLGGMVRQLSLEHFENESRRIVPLNNDLSQPTKKFTRQKSPQGLHKKASNISICFVFSSLLFVEKLYMFALFKPYFLLYRSYLHCLGLKIGNLLLIGGFF